MKDFMINFRQLMAVRNITQVELSRRTGLDANTISGYLNGKALPNVDTARIIAEALDVSLDWLSGRDNYDISDEATLRQSYSQANHVMRQLARWQKHLTPLQWRAVKRQALLGDVEGADKTLHDILVDAGLLRSIETTEG